MPTVESRGLASRRKAEREVFKLSLMGLFVASCDKDTFEKTMPFLKSFCRYMVLVGITNTVIVSTEIDDKFEVVLDINTIAHSVPGQLRKDTSTLYSTSVGTGIDPTVINELIVDRITTACPVQTTMALDLIDSVVQTGKEHVLSEYFTR